MNQAQKIELWKEIIGTAENGDPSYSYRLFSETIDRLQNTKPRGKKG